MAEKFPRSKEIVTSQWPDNAMESQAIPAQLTFSNFPSHRHAKEFGVDVRMFNEDDIVPKRDDQKSYDHNSMNHHLMKWSVAQEEQHVEEPNEFVASVCNKQPIGNKAGQSPPSCQSTQLPKFNIHLNWEQAPFGEKMEELYDLESLRQAQHFCSFLRTLGPSFFL